MATTLEQYHGVGRRKSSVARVYLRPGTGVWEVNGRPLEVDGKYAAFRRVNDSGDPRSNMHAGGKAKAAKVDDTILQLVEAVRPKLINDGMFLVGLDIVGSKLMEVNVDTPGGINVAEDLAGVDFSGRIISDLARKVRLQAQYRGTLGNVELAML